VRLVHVDLSELLDWHLEVVRYFFHVAFGDEHALWAAEASECGIGDSVGFAYASSYIYVGDIIDTI
jgi:hypothetical protein